MSRESRRTFLKQAAAGVGTLGLAGLKAPREAIAQPAKPAFKYSICNETFQDWPQEKIFKFAAECGYRGVEIAPFTINLYVDKIPAARRAELRKAAEEAGVEMIGLHWILSKTEGFHLTSPDPQVRKRTTAYLGELARFCADLGGKLLVFGSPKQRSLLPGVSREQGMEFAAEVLKAAMPACEKHGTTIAMEPLTTKETNFLTCAADAVELAERVDSPRCRMMLDCKAMSSEPTPMPDLIRKYAQWMIHFHANDPNLQGPGFGKLDFVPLFKALVDVDYRGWVSVEMFDYSPGPERLARESLAYMRKCEAAARG
jgi:sugar phosphate isomerase/epimerase